MKNSVLLTIARPIRVFSTLIGSALLAYIGLRYPVLYVICIPTLVAMLAFFNFFATYNKLQLQVEKKKQEELEAQEAAEKEAAERLEADYDDDDDDDDDDFDDEDTSRSQKRI